MIWLKADALIAAMAVPTLATTTVLHGIATPTGHATSALPRPPLSARRLPALPHVAAGCGRNGTTFARRTHGAQCG